MSWIKVSMHKDTKEVTLQFPDIAYVLSLEEACNLNEELTDLILTVI